MKIVLSGESVHSIVLAAALRRAGMETSVLNSEITQYNEFPDFNSWKRLCDWALVIEDSCDLSEPGSRILKLLQTAGASGHHPSLVIDLHRPAAWWKLPQTVRKEISAGLTRQLTSNFPQAFADVHGQALLKAVVGRSSFCEGWPWQVLLCEPSGLPGMDVRIGHLINLFTTQLMPDARSKRWIEMFDVRMQSEAREVLSAIHAIDEVAPGIFTARGNEKVEPSRIWSALEGDIPKVLLVNCRYPATRWLRVIFAVKPEQAIADQLTAIGLRSATECSWTKMFMDKDDPRFQELFDAALAVVRQL